MGTDLSEELHKVSSLLTASIDLEARLSSAISLPSSYRNQSFSNSLHFPLLQEALSTLSQLRLSSHRLLKGLIEGKITLLSDTLPQTGLSAESHETISDHIVTWHQTVKKSSDFPILIEGYLELSTDLGTALQGLRKDKEAAVELAKARQRDLLEKRKREVDYVGVVKLATEEAVAAGREVMGRLAALEGRCKWLESKLGQAEVDLARIKRISASRRPTEPSRPFNSLFLEFSPLTPKPPRHKHSRSTSIRPAFPPPLATAMEHLDAMNEQVEALATLLCGDRRSQQAESLQTCVVSYRFRTLLSGFERWREVIA